MLTKKDGNERVNVGMLPKEKRIYDAPCVKWEWVLDTLIVDKIFYMSFITISVTSANY
jgi:hypothetical protein